MRETRRYRAAVYGMRLMFLSGVGLACAGVARVPPLIVVFAVTCGVGFLMTLPFGFTAPWVVPVPSAWISLSLYLDAITFGWRKKPALGEDVPPPRTRSTTVEWWRLPR